MNRRTRKVPRWLKVKRQREAERRASTHAEREHDRQTAGLLVWVLFVAFILAVFGLTCHASRAHAAARVPVTWTAPAGARSYEAIARRPDGVYLALPLAADSAAAAALVPAQPGAPQTGWLLISTDWRAGAWMVWVRGCNAAGCAPWSNAVVALAGIPDTLWHLERLGADGIRPPRERVAFKRAAGRVGWALERADSLTAATIEHQETVQVRERGRLCALFGHWALGGQQWPCP